MDGLVFGLSSLVTAEWTDTGPAHTIMTPEWGQCLHLKAALSNLHFYWTVWPCTAPRQKKNNNNNQEHNVLSEEKPTSLSGLQHSAQSWLNYYFQIPQTWNNSRKIYGLVENTELCYRPWAVTPMKCRYGYITFYSDLLCTGIKSKLAPTFNAMVS